MIQRYRIYQALRSLVLLGLVLFLVGCDAGGGDSCAGTGGRVSCLEVETIAPIDSNGVNSTNVDAFQDLCSVDDAGVPTFEIFTDHSAQITFINEAFPGASDSFDIRLTSFSVSYRLNDCPAGATGCPSLVGFSSSQSLLILAGSTTAATFPFVPLRVKDAYADAGGSEISPPSYTVTYTFTAQTTPFNDTLQVTASQEFTIGNYNLCDTQ